MTNNFRRLLITFSVLGLMAVPAVVYARDGSSGSGSNKTSTSDSTDNSGSGSIKPVSAQVESENESETEAETHTAEVEVHKTRAKTEAKNFLATVEAKQKKHTEQERKKNCQAAEKGLQTKLSNLQKNSASFKSKIDAVYQKALDYQTANSLSPAGIDGLEATANAAKATAAASVSALSGLSVDLDCTSSTVAENVATFRASAKQARDDLKAYKTAVKAVLVALKEAADE